MIAGIGIEPGLVSAFPELLGSASFEPMLWTTAWRTEGRTGALVAGLVGDSVNLGSSSGIPWVLVGLGNNRPWSQSWKYNESELDHKGKLREWKEDQ